MSSHKITDVVNKTLELTNAISGICKYMYLANILCKLLIW